MSDPAGTDWSIPAIIGAIGTAIGALCGVIGTHLLGLRKQNAESAAIEHKQDSDDEERLNNYAASVMRDMFDRQQLRILHLEKRADDCEQDRAGLTAKVHEGDQDRVRMSVRISHLEAQIGRP